MASRWHCSDRTGRGRVWRGIPVTALLIVAVSGLVGSAAGAAAPDAGDQPATTVDVGLPPTTMTEVVVDVAIPPSIPGGDVAVATPPIPPLPDTGGDELLVAPAVDVATPPAPIAPDAVVAIAGAVAATASTAWRNG